MPRGFSERVSAKVGYYPLASSTIGWPFACVDVTEDGIALKTVLSQHYFDKASVYAIRKHFFLFSVPPTGVQILHTKVEDPPYVAIFPFNRKEFMSRLKQLGFPVEDG
jgi:hypothetical protein